MGLQLMCDKLRVRLYSDEEEWLKNAKCIFGRFHYLPPESVRRRMAHALYWLLKTHVSIARQRPTDSLRAELKGWQRDVKQLEAEFLASDQAQPLCSKQLRFLLSVPAPRFSPLQLLLLQPAEKMRRWRLLLALPAFLLLRTPAAW
jgi:hypothetical protein